MTAKFLKAQDAMKFLGIKSYRTLQVFIEAGLPYTEINGTKYFTSQGIYEFMTNHEVSKVD